MKRTNTFNPDTISILSQDHPLVSHNTDAPVLTSESEQKSKSNTGWSWGKITKFFKKAAKLGGAVAAVIGTVAVAIGGIAKCISNHAKVIKAQASLIKERRRYEKVKNDPRYVF